MSGRFRFALAQLAGFGVLLLTCAANEAIAEDFGRRCAAPGVVVCEGFDNQKALDWDARQPNGKGFFWVGVRPAAGQGTLDTVVKSSGRGSLRFNTPDPRGPDGAATAGAFRLPFRRGFREGDTFYMQWRMRFSPEMLAINRENSGGGEGFKQVIVHGGTATCAATELTFTNMYFSGYPTWYTACGARSVRNELPGARYRVQQGDYAACIYPQNLSREECWYFTPNEWLTFYWRVSIGRSGLPDSHLEAWAARESGPFEKIFDKADMILTSSGDYDSVTLTPYMNSRGSSGTPTHAQAYVWYDEVIVSTKPIAPPDWEGRGRAAKAARKPAGVGAAK